MPWVSDESEGPNNACPIVETMILVRYHEKLSLSNSLEDRASVDEMFGCPLSR